MNSAQLKLVATLLERQLEHNNELIAPERIYQALTSGPTFTQREKQLLWISPVARNLYLSEKRRIKQQLEQTLKQNNVVRLIIPAAASTGADRIEINGEDYTLQLQKDVEDWLLIVTLGERFKASLYAMTTLQLSDSDGLLWLSGRPDQFGQIIRKWPHPDLIPSDRLRFYSLSLSVL